jgi:hypothetical protein
VLRSDALVLAAVCASVMLTFPTTVRGGASDPPNWAPELTFSYADPVSGERHECGGDCRRFEVPAGVDLLIRVQALNVSEHPGGDPVSWDLWFDQPRSPLPAEDLAACIDEDQRLDTECWYAMMNRVDWKWWGEQVADRECVPEDPGDCVDETISVPMRADFEGSRGRGVYTFLVWTDRFDTVTESDEFDNVAGPVRVKAVPKMTIDEVEPPESPSRLNPEAQGVAPATTAATERRVVSSPRSARSYSARILQDHEEKGFNVTSSVGRAILEFSPSYAGAVTVEVQPVGAWEKMTVAVRKVSTGEVFAEISGKGRLRIEGTIEKVQLVDDRAFEVVVQPEQGTRGIRGTISVSYPSRAVYIRRE